MAELQIIQELVKMVGPAGAVLLMLGWFFIYRRDQKEHPPVDREGTLLARDRITKITAHVEAMRDDITEIKKDIKTTNGAFLRHLENHP